MTSLQLREQLRLSQIEVYNWIEKLMQMEGDFEGNKLKVKAFEIERDSRESENKKKISESQRERKKLHAKLKAETVAKNLHWKSPFSTLRVSLIFFVAGTTTA